MIVVLMGVCSSGKTTVGLDLSKSLRLPFYDADEFHPPTSIEKMERGIPVEDEDRLPWLGNLSRKIRAWENEGGAVLACSALKHLYRRILSESGAHLEWVYLKGSKELIEERMKGRENHFMPPSLLDSQFDILEEPGPEAIVMSIELSVEVIVSGILKELREREQARE